MMAGKKENQNHKQNYNSMQENQTEFSTDTLSSEFETLPAEDQKLLQDIFSGRALPPLYSDCVAKTVFHSDIHPDRLAFLLRGIAEDDTIRIYSSAGNELFRPSLQSKGMVLDIATWLEDLRLADMEVQKIKQDFIFTRAELYSSDMLLLQYSAEKGQKKKIDYSNVREILLVVLMVKSPEAFVEYDTYSDRYIHRFRRITADSGLSYHSKKTIIYVQLDKCLKQFKEGKNAETGDGKPDRLQLWLSAIADINDDGVVKEAMIDEELRAVIAEAHNMVQDKEVQKMLIQERYERMDWLSYGNGEREEGRKEGIKEGIKEGRTEGIFETLIALVKNHLITIQEAAKQAGVSESAFIEKMKESGDRITDLF